MKNMKTICEIASAIETANVVFKKEENRPNSFLSYEKGRKYVKVIINSECERSVWCFIDMDGNLYKPASWKAPHTQFYSRYN